MLKDLIADHQIKNLIIKRNDAVLDFSDQGAEPPFFLDCRATLRSFIEDVDAIDLNSCLSACLNDLATAATIVQDDRRLLGKAPGHLVEEIEIVDVHWGVWTIISAELAPRVPGRGFGTVRRYPANQNVL